MGGQDLAPRDFRDRDGTGARARGVRVDALREDREARGFGGSRWLRWLRWLSQARTHATTVIRVTVTSPGMTAMWFMVVFPPSFSRLGGDPLKATRSRFSGARGAWILPPGAGNVRMNPLAVAPAPITIALSSPMTVGRVIGKSPSMWLKPSIHEDAIPGVLLL